MKEQRGRFVDKTDANRLFADKGFGMQQKHFLLDLTLFQIFHMGLRNSKFVYI